MGDGLKRAFAAARASRKKAPKILVTRKEANLSGYEAKFEPDNGETVFVFDTLLSVPHRPDPKWDGGDLKIPGPSYVPAGVRDLTAGENKLYAAIMKKYGEEFYEFVDIRRVAHRRPRRCLPGTPTVCGLVPVEVGTTCSSAITQCPTCYPTGDGAKLSKNV